MTASVSRETGSSIEGGVSRETRPGLLTRGVLLPIRLYRHLLSPAFGARCRYYPSCSAYAEQAVRELGPLRGMILAAWRLLRCNPFSKGGLDPVSERRLFRAEQALDQTRSKELA